MNIIVDVGKHPVSYLSVRHVQPVWEFIYCTGGAGIVRFDGEQLEFSHGMVIGIPPNQPYTLVPKGTGPVRSADLSGLSTGEAAGPKDQAAHKGTGPARSADLSNVSTGEVAGPKDQVTHKVFQHLYVRIQDTIFYRKRPFVFSDNREELVLSAFRGAYLHFLENSETSHFILRAYSYLIVAYAKSYRIEQIRNETVKDILDNIHRNYSNAHYELDTYMESLPFSADYIRKLFKRETGVTPHRYLSDLRLTEAEGWLNSMGKEANITEIARRCGFREPLYFSRMFKKKYGQSPLLYVAEKAEQPQSAD